MGAKANLLIFLEKENVKKSDFYQHTGLSNGFLDKNENISSQNIEIIISKYPNLSIDWLITGQGEIFKTKSTQIDDITSISDSKDVVIKDKDNNKNHISQKKINKNLIPLYDDAATIGGTNEMVANTQGATQVSEWIDAGDWFKEATAAIRHYGDSMVEYPSGSILALKEVTDKNLILWGKDYVIETSEYRVTKRIQRGKTKGYIRAYSTNEETYKDGRLIHEPLDVPLDHTKLFIVLGYVVKNFGSGTVYIKNNTK